MKLIENNQINLLAKAMDAYALRQKMTASNVANIDTLGYKKVSVAFENELQQAQKTLPGHESLDSVNPRIVQTDEQPILENEMLEMADTQMRIQLVTRSLRENFEQLRTGITGRTQ